MSNIVCCGLLIWVKIKKIPWTNKEGVKALFIIFWAKKEKLFSVYGQVRARPLPNLNQKS